MMKLTEYIFLTVFVLLLTVSCRDEDAARFPDFQSGVNARVFLYPDRSYINLDDLDNASVAFDVYSVNTDIDELIYTAHYVDADSATANFPSFDAIRVPGSAFVNGKATEVGISAAELAAGFGLPGGPGYFEGADNVTFTARAVLKDGRVIDGSNSAPSITGGGAASFTTSFVTYVGCPSPVEDITGKTYTATIRTYNSANNPPFGLPDTSTKTGVTIRFVGPEPFRYEVSSHDAGWWARPDITGTEGGPGQFFDICSQIVMQPKASFGFGGANDSGGGSYDPATGVIKINWYNSFNDIYGDVVYTPEN
jgi:hypothetical protein